MAGTVIIDAGPIVALLSSRDDHHRWAQAQFQSMEDPCVTCEGVISECYHLLEASSQALERLLGFLERGLIRVDFEFDNHVTESLRLLRKYGDRPMSFADGCLVRMSEIFERSTVFTTDRDFVHYRRYERQVIPLLAPWR